MMLAQLLAKHGLKAGVEAAHILSTQNLFRLETGGVALVCLSYLDASSPAHMRYAVRRLRRKAPQATILLGCWTPATAQEGLAELRAATKADLVAATLSDAVRQCLTLAQGHVTVGDASGASEPSAARLA